MSTSGLSQRLALKSAIIPFLRVQYSVVFVCVQLCAGVFSRGQAMLRRVQVCSVIFSFVQSCLCVFNRVHSCSFVDSCVLSCSFVLTCVLLRAGVFRRCQVCCVVVRCAQ